MDHKLPISRLAVFGPETKKWLEKTNLIPENNIVVTGAPRTDTYLGTTLFDGSSEK